MCPDLTRRWSLSSISRSRTLALAGLVAALTGCGGGSSGDGGGDPAPDASANGGMPAPGGAPGPTGGGGGSTPVGGTPIDGGAIVPVGGGEPPPENFEATRANLRFKGAARLREDYGRVLQLPADALCKELGLYDCVTEIHQIALGGVEPYKANIFVPFPGVAVGAPLAVERLALSGCGERVRRDLATPDAAVFFGRLPVDAAGALSTIDAPEVDAALTRLFREALLREPTRADLDVVKGLYADVVAEGGPEPARTWATLACTTVLTTTEALLF